MQSIYHIVSAQQMVAILTNISNNEDDKFMIKFSSFIIFQF